MMASRKAMSAIGCHPYADFTRSIMGIHAAGAMSFGPNGIDAAVWSSAFGLCHQSVVHFLLTKVDRFGFP